MVAIQHPELTDAGSRKLQRTRRADAPKSKDGHSLVSEGSQFRRAIEKILGSASNRAHEMVVPFWHEPRLVLPGRVLDAEHPALPCAGSVRVLFLENCASDDDRSAVGDYD
jgi:hypothetical protein